jgi:hypothetical protein
MLPVAADGETVAVNVIVCPTVEGFTLEANVKEVVPFIEMETAAEELAATFESPKYLAVIEWGPSAKVDVANVAMPEPTGVVPIAAPLSRNWILPVAVAGVIVAVKLTVCP